MAGYSELFLRTAKDAMRPAVVVCDRTTPCEKVIARLAETGSNCAVITRGGGRVVGQLSGRDVAHRVAFRVAPETPVSEVLTGPVRVARHDERLYRLVGVMRVTRAQYLPVVDDAGRVIGLLSRADALGAGLPRYLERLDRFAQSATVSGLRAIRQAQSDLAGDLLADRLDAPEIQALLSGINEDIYRQLTANAVEGLALDGWGRPPAAFAVMVMGSGGRRESFLGPDQDNGLIIADYPDAEHTAVDAYFAEFAARLNRDLDQVGIPYCQGHVMARNPLWRKSHSQWLAQLDYWMRSRRPQVLLNASVLLDFRVVCGDVALGQSLRRLMVERVGGSPGFMRALMLADSPKEVGLGWFDRLVTESDDSIHQGEINLKRHGIMPIVEAVRLYALAHGVEATATRERMRRLHELGALNTNDLDALTHAHGFMCHLLLAHQVQEVAAGRAPRPHLPPETLTRREHDQLVRSMKTSQGLLRRLRKTLVGDI
ncbi:DUF294 nucleotidyltransferase-like domain-containing protein [Alkalilimnicola ehrlichii MLHE-1]|uniref:Putative signal-transduction protein with CBS domains n=1 Tax=Alkalilimnicola ehrlichii (strain ATCC BAA-1101 / DSM 17681 / MLHE-1) TaxID=187272 RepID=Q0A6Y9_ALKEH|nr:DUF294 nucleotidyltransferase-like domain-containing protein [Alkalilimnicola ehrlichii]ABI57398.1 putative signal-transduction protein with CBS domains [Alkalilimnicola ehrlichii MLHE-1]